MKPELQTCPNCGAPMKLDASGACSFCRAPIRTSLAIADQPLLPGRLLRAMSALMDERAVQRVVESKALQACSDALVHAVTEAGQRVVDAGLVLDPARVDVGIFEPAEIWTFNLGADLVALLVAADNMPKAKRAAVRQILTAIDANLGTHGVRSTIGNATPGPEALREFRQAIPHRTAAKS